jgi:uncharacterized protein
LLDCTIGERYTDADFLEAVMTRFALSLAVVFFLTLACSAQNSTDDTPATREDVQRYLQIVQSREMAKKMFAVMAQAAHQMEHEQYLKHKDELPADYETKMNARVDEMFGNMPWDEMLQAMVPAYQRHFTKGDIDNLVAFYSSPTGAKLLRETPAMMAEAMQDMMPIVTRYTETVKDQLQKETDDMIAQAKKQTNALAPAKN